MLRSCALNVAVDGAKEDAALAVIKYLSAVVGDICRAYLAFYLPLFVQH
jgi:hypothetical protein